MSSKVGATIKGYIKNLSTGVIKPFQFNPETFEYSRGATYSEIASPGMSYPSTQYVRGNAREFSMQLFLFDKPCSGIIKSYKEFLESFLPPEENSIDFKKPPEMLLCYNDFIKRCVLLELGVINEEYDTQGNVTIAYFNLSLRQVGS